MRHKLLLLLFTSIILSSCLTIERMENFTSKSSGGSLDMTVKKSIFNSFLWIEPPMSSRKVDFEEQKGNLAAVIDFAGKPLSLTIDENKALIVEYEGSTTAPLELKTSVEKNIYYDYSVLGRRPEQIQRLVTKTRYVTKQVLVTKQIPVQRSRTVSDYNPSTNSTSFRTEYYTDYETRTEYETQTVPETYTEWETVTIYVLDIPQYKYYEYSDPEKGLYFFLYAVKELHETVYHFQNPSYYEAFVTDTGFFVERDVRLVMVDSNSNGIYFENDDQILFNTWNPFDRNAVYMAINSFSGNNWYTFNYLKYDRFLTFGANSEKNLITVTDANSKFFGSTETGVISISGLDKKDCRIYINSERYNPRGNGTFERKIEYGIYKLIIEKNGYVSYEKNIIVDSDTPTFVLEYKPGEKAGSLYIESRFETMSPFIFLEWDITIKDAEGNQKSYRKNYIDLKEGEYEVTYLNSYMRNSVTKKVTIVKEEETLIETE